MSHSHITVGILAHNEAGVIGRTIESLAAQSVFDPLPPALPDFDAEVVVVPNGCTDDTQAQAEQALDAASTSHPTMRWRVVALREAGKSRAWNELVHQIASPRTDVFVMMDADIVFGHPDTIRNCVRRLLDDAKARAVVDLPLEDFHRNARPTLLQRLSMRVSAWNLDEEPAISGQFYVSGGERMRDIWMPFGLSVEDGFLHAMVATDGFRESPDAARIVRAQDATHYYDGLTRAGELLQHETRILVGTVLNALLCWDVLHFMTPRDGPGAGRLIGQLNAEDPSWYPRMMSNQVKIRGRWAVGRAHVGRRFSSWRALPRARRLRRLPATMALSAVDLLVAWRANRVLVSGRAVGYW